VYINNVDNERGQQRQARQEKDKTMESIKQFKVGKTYTVDGSDIINFKVVKRTAQFVTMKRTNSNQAAIKMKVRIYNGRENVNPYGFALIFA